MLLLGLMQRLLCKLCSQGCCRGPPLYTYQLSFQNDVKLHLQQAAAQLSGSPPGLGSTSGGGQGKGPSLDRKEMTIWRLPLSEAVVKREPFRT